VGGGGGTRGACLSFMCYIWTLEWLYNMAPCMHVARSEGAYLGFRAC
jgi:hypothetical protein